MNRIFTIIIVILIGNMTFAQPGWVKKAAKSVFTVKTFAADGTLIGSANGFFVGENGEAVSSFTPFRGSSRAIIIDAQGKEMEVECIIGADETYDVVKFRVAGKRTSPLLVASAPSAEGGTAWLLPYSAKKTPAVRKGEISKAEVFQDKYTYYTINLEVPDNTSSCPFLNDNGEVIGMLQHPTEVREATCYAVSANFANDMKTSGLSINEPAMKSIAIKKELPDDINQAILSMYIANSTLDSVQYGILVGDFIKKFPNAPDGYIYRAQISCDANRFNDAECDMEQAIKVAEKKDDAHYNYSNLIYRKEIYKSDIPYERWSLDKAADEVEKAYEINPIPIYRQQKAQIRLVQKRYDDAYNIYSGLINNGTRTAEVFFAAARCKELLNDTTAMIALLDSAVNTFTKPYLRSAAPYLLARAQALDKSGRYRQAVADYNEYEKLMSTQVNDSFYYIRSQAEMNGNMFQQALNDIGKAIEMSPDNTLYYAEKASIEVRVGLLDEAIATSKECIRLDDRLSDGYLFLGFAQCLKGEKEEGIRNLQKAEDLGDEQARTLIDKYR